MAPGADIIGKDWAEKLQIPVDQYPADWERYGKKAGIVRNIEMAKNANGLIAFWDGKSPGTRNMISTALNHGLEVHVYQYKGE